MLSPTVEVFILLDTVLVLNMHSYLVPISQTQDPNRLNPRLRKRQTSKLWPLLTVNITVIICKDFLIAPGTMISASDFEKLSAPITIVSVGK